jgi:hypothetical protein
MRHIFSRYRAVMAPLDRNGNKTKVSFLPALSRVEAKREKGWNYFHVKASCHFTTIIATIACVLL